VTLDATDGNNASGTATGIPAGVYSFDLPALAYGEKPHLSMDLQLAQGTNLSPAIRFRNAAYLRPAIAGSLVIAISQQLDAVQATSIAVLVAADGSNYSGPMRVAVDYRLLGAGAWTEHIAVPYETALTTTITGLAPSSRYEVRARLLIQVAYAGWGAATTTDPVVMFTRIAAPTATIATVGTGTPVTEIRVTPPGVGFDTKIRNAAGTYDALHAAVASTATTYQSTAGACGKGDRYWVWARNTQWPAGFQYSAPVELDIVNPCVVS
jgi:hypothetical protein